MNPNNPSAPNEDQRTQKKAKRVVTIEERERDFVIGMIALVVALTTLPHLFGYAVPKAGYRFVGTAYNIDDYLVYLSWLYQTSHGSFFIKSLFTTDQQPTLLFNFLLSLIGGIERVTHWTPQASIEFVRVLGAIGLLTLVYRFYRYCIPQNRSARLTAFGLVCFSSGFGWTTWRHWSNANPPGSPVDAWQPEAYTFTSIYVNVLFVIATILIVGLLYSLLLAVRTGKIRYAWIAAVCGFLMGDVHSYDVLHVSAAWGLFLVVWSIVRFRYGIGKMWLYSVITLAFTLPTTLWVYHAYKTNPVFNSRAESPTLTPSFNHYITGYGIVTVFVVVAIVMFVLRRREALSKSMAASEPSANVDDRDSETGIETLRALEIGWADRASLFFVWCWAIAGCFVIYLPFNFQRKMLMGLHIPLCLLAGWGASVAMHRLPKPARILALSLIVAVSFISNGFVIKRDMMHMSRNVSETQQWPVLSPQFVGALSYLETQTPANAPILSIPFYAAYIPGYTGHPVWAGHWSETPDYTNRVQALIKGFDSSTSDAQRQAFLQSTGCRYLLYLTKASDAAYTDKSGRSHAYMDLASNPPSYLRPVYANSEFTVFEIR